MLYSYNKNIRLFLSSLIYLLAFFFSGICFHHQIFLFIYFSLTSDWSNVLSLLQLNMQLQKGILVTWKSLNIYLHFRSEHLPLLKHAKLLVHDDKYEIVSSGNVGFLCIQLPFDNHFNSSYIFWSTHDFW